MKIIIKKGEPLWSEDGHHILDDRGFAKVSEELHKEIVITNPDAVERVKKSLRRERWDELYLIALDSSAEFIKDKEQQLLNFEQEKIENIKNQLEEKNAKLQAAHKKRQKEMEQENERFQQERRLIREMQESEMEEYHRKYEEEQRAKVAAEEAELAKKRAEDEPKIAARKAKEKAEADAKEALIQDLVNRINKLEKK